MRHLLAELPPASLPREKLDLWAASNQVSVHTLGPSWPYWPHVSVFGLGDLCHSPTKQPVRATDLTHDVKFGGYSCTDALHFSLGTAISKTLQYSDEGPAKGQTEICLRIWANICEQFPPFFSKLYIWPARPREAGSLLKYFWGLQWLKKLPESNS